MDYKLQIEGRITGFEGVFFSSFCHSLTSFSLLPSFLCPHVAASLRDGDKGKHGCRGARTLQGGQTHRSTRTHFFPPPARSSANAPIRKTAARVRRRKLQVFAHPGEWRGSTSLLYDKKKTSPISDGIQFTPPERGGGVAFQPAPLRPTLTTARKTRPAVAVHCDGLLNTHFSQFTVSAAAFGRAFHPYPADGCSFFRALVASIWGSGAASQG